jgi:hypothetical protein
MPEYHLEIKRFVFGKTETVGAYYVVETNEGIEQRSSIGYSMEAPDRNNQPFVSCIPRGEYQLVPFESSEYGNTFALVNHDLKVFRTKVANEPDQRYACLLHWGNVGENYIGCVGRGKYILGMDYKGKVLLAVTDTKNCHKRLLEILEEKNITKLVITN